MTGAAAMGETLETARAAARAAFAETGLPHRRLEAWKYTDLRARLREIPPPAAALAGPPPAHDLFAALDVPRVAVRNGRVGPRAAIAGLDLAALAEAPPPPWAEARLAGAGRGLAMATLNLARAADGLLLRVPAGRGDATALHLAFDDRTADAADVETRHLVLLEPGAALTLIESHGGAAAPGSLANHVLEIVLGAGARLTHVRVHADGAAPNLVATLICTLDRDARYALTTLNAGAGLSRTELHARLEGTGAHVDVTGLSLLAGYDHADVTTHLTHAAPRTTASQVVKSVLAGEARAVYQGKVTVAAGALGTDSHQLAKAVLLSDRAEAMTKPELEILADDVKCGHGASIGALDRAALFYLRSRGVPAGAARALLTEAFIADALARLEDARLRDVLAACAAARLAALEDRA